jgi:SAM-dependent methyltransferase
VTKHPRGLEPSPYWQFDRFELETNYPIATASLDHLFPCGTAHDNSRNFLFNKKLSALIPSDRPPRVLDLGCAGGAFVKSCLDDGWASVGLEGSDYSRRLGRGHWGTLDGRSLFTADITKPFLLTMHFAGRAEPFRADVVTAWEVLEHIDEGDIGSVSENIRRHVLPTGLVFASISTHEFEAAGARLHRTVKGRDWWTARLAENGLHAVNDYWAFFNGHFVRGPRQDTPDSFNLILSTDPEHRPQVPKLSALRRLYDLWLESPPQRFLSKLIGTTYSS